MKPHVLKFFQFLEAKEGKNAPLKVKLLNQDKFNITKDELNVNGDFSLANSSIMSFPNGLWVSGYMYLSGCTSLKSLPNDLYVGTHLNLEGCTSLEALPDGLQVGEFLTLNGCTSLRSLPDRLQVGRSLYLRETPLAKMYSEDEIRDMIEVKGGYVKKYIFV